MITRMANSRMSLLLALTLSLSITQQAQTPTPSAKPVQTSPKTPAQSSAQRTAEGTIQKIDFSSRSFQIAPHTYHWSHTTRITEARHAVKESALSNGAFVQIVWIDEKGKRVCRSIRIVPPAPPAQPKPPRPGLPPTR